MNNLSNLKCEACDISAKLLSPTEISELLPTIADWQLVEIENIQRLKRVYQTDNYSKSLLFTNLIAELSETENHHPKITLEYSCVTIEWWSHKIKGLHKNDFIMASKTNKIFVSQITDN